MAVMAADAYTMVAPEVNVRDDAPSWARNMFPALIEAIYATVNKSFVNVVIDFNKSIEHLQSQMNTMDEKMDTQSRSHNSEITELKKALKTKQYQVDSQAAVISDLKDTIDKNVSYSRKVNLIFGGITLKNNEQRSCADIVRQDIFTKALGMSNDASQSIKFVRCHHLTKRPGDSKSKIIVRFESFEDRTRIWNQRRSLKMVYVTEDFPFDIRRKRNKLKPILRAAGKHPQYAKCISIKSDKLLFKGELLTVDNLQALPNDINPKSLSEVKTDEVLVFGGINSDYHELSNYYPVEFTFRNQKFNCAEQAYQHSKATMFGDERAAAAILQATDPANQKYLARNIRGFKANTWNNAKVKLMKDIIHNKFSQHHQLAEQLCDTGDLHLGEASLRDTFYGTGLSLNHQDTTIKINGKVIS